MQFRKLFLSFAALFPVAFLMYFLTDGEAVEVEAATSVRGSERQSVARAEAKETVEKLQAASVVLPGLPTDQVGYLVATISGEVTGEVSLWAANETKRNWFFFSSNGLVRGMGPELFGRFTAEAGDVIVVNGRWYKDGVARELVERESVYIVSVSYGGNPLRCEKTYPKDYASGEESMFPDFYCVIP